MEGEGPIWWGDLLPSPPETTGARPDTPLDSRTDTRPDPWLDARLDTPPDSRLACRGCSLCGKVATA